MKMVKLLKWKDAGSIGIGAMIVFIAMVLVAGIAASVLIQTSTKLETQAMSTGQETIEEVSSGIAVYDIVGKKNTDLRYAAITVRARGGSPDIDLNQTVILISDGTDKCLLSYDGHNDAGHYANAVGTNGQLFGTDTWTDLTEEEFGIIVLEDADNSVLRMTPVINKGDKVVLSLQFGGATGALSAEIAERTDVFGKVIPEVGSPGIISFTTPSSYSDTVYDLQ